MQLEGHVATFSQAPGAQARLQALDGRMIGGPGLVEDPDAIRARRLGSRRWFCQEAAAASTIAPRSSACTRQGLAAFTMGPLLSERR
jgi:hypothetical protein